VPMAPTSYCTQPGCSTRVRSGHCDAHSRHAQLNARRGSAASNGYDRAWQRFRLGVLIRHPLCADCHDAGRLTVAVEVHHVVKVRDDRRRRLDPTNVRSLCKACHSRRTARGE
jgi:5-methylcytosine-specific restriction protein A